MPMVHFRWSLRATLIGATWAASSARSCAAGPAAALAVLARRVLACARGPDLGPLAAWTVGQWCRARAHRSARRWYSRSPSRRHRHTVDARPCCKTGARGLAPARGGSASSAARGRKPCRARDCLLPDPALKPVATSLFEFQGRFSRDWGLTSAGSVIMVIPIIVLFLLLQRRFIEGLTQGGLKG